jgi:hypothetical protein
MARTYAVPFNGTITAAGTDTDIWSFQPATNKPIELKGFTLGQTSEIGDAMEENLRITVKRLPATFTVGSGGSAVTAKPPNASSGDPEWGATVRINDTTVATSSGTVEILDEFGWNERNTPYEHWYPDGPYCPSAYNGQGLVIRCETTLIDDMTFSGTAWFEEEGI